MRHKPAAFFSYVHFNDETDGGRLTEFRKRLSAEVQMQTGEEFPIFQDKDLVWGENWKKRINESLDSTTFLIPVITPSFFNSQPCLDELERFLDREKKLGTEELILPVYYVDSPLINQRPQGTTRKEKLAQIIASRQYFDWRDLRFEPITSAVISKTISELAGHIRQALQRVQEPAKAEAAAGRKRESLDATENVASVAGAVSSAPSREQVSLSAETPTKVASKTDPPVRLVDPMHRGDYTTIMEAIQAANPGDRILVRAGLYEEGIVIDKPLEIIGDALAGEVVIRAVGKHTVTFKTSMGRIANLTLRQVGGGRWFGVDVAQGRLEIEDCDISSASLSCVAVHGGADPRLRRNRIHDGKEAGIFLYENAQGTVEDNDIFENGHAGISVITAANPTVRRNRIHDGKQGGVYVKGSGQGTFEDNEIVANALAGVEIKDGANPIFRRNRIHDGRQGGVYVHGNGQGTFEENDIFANAFSGVAVKTGGCPVFRRNQIHNGKQSGVSVHENGRGIFEGNEIFSNTFSGVIIKVGGNPVFRRNQIHDGLQAGVFVLENGQGIFEDGQIFRNAFAGVEVTKGGSPVVRRNRISDNGREAIRIYKQGGGSFEKNDLRGNDKGAWMISEDSASNVRRSDNTEE